MRLLASLGAGLYTAAGLSHSHRLHAADQPPSRGRPVIDEDLIEARAQAMGRVVRCLVCANQNIEESESDIAVELRRFIRARLREGRSEDEIGEILVDRYGEAVLYKPPFSWHTGFLYFLPLAAMVVAFGAVALVRRRRSAGLADAAVVAASSSASASGATSAAEAGARMARPRHVRSTTRPTL